MMKHFFLLMMGALLSLAPAAAQPDLDLDFEDCDCPMVNTPPVCAEVLPGFVIPLPSACFAECMGLTVIEGGDCAMNWDGDFEDWDDYGDWDDDDEDDEDDSDGDDDDDSDGDDDDDYGNWGNWDDDDDDDDDDYGNWGNWGDDDDDDDDDYGDWGDWSDSTWTDSTWTGGGYPGGDWNDSLYTDIDFDLLDSLLNDWLANGGMDLVDSLLGELENGGVIVLPDWVDGTDLDSLLLGGDFGWLDSLLVGGGFPWDGPGFPGGGLDSLLGDIDWNELDSLLNGGGLDSIGTGGLPWFGLNVDLDGIWEDKGPEEAENIGGGQQNRDGEAGWALPEALTWSCFPVPATTELNIQADGAVSGWEIWTVSGQILQRNTTLFEGRTTLDVSTFAPGTYIVRVQDASGAWFSQSVLVQ